MGHTTRVTAQNMAALAFAALAGTAAAQPAKLPPLPEGRLYPQVKPENYEKCYRAIVAYPGRCPAPLNRHVPGEWMWLENESGGLKPGAYNLVAYQGQCYPITDVQSLGEPLAPAGVTKVQECYPLERLPDTYVAPPLPAGAKTIKQLKADQVARQQADQQAAQAAATPQPVAAAPTLPSGQKWYQAPNYLPPVVDYSKLSATPQVINAGTVYKEVNCQLSNGLKVEPGSGVILDNRLVVHVGRQDCALTPLIEVVQNGQSPSTFSTAQPLLEAIAKVNPPFSGLFSGDMNVAQDFGTKFYPGKAVVAAYGPMAPFSALITAAKPSLGIPPNQPIKVEAGNDCKLPDGKTAKPGDGYIPADKSAIYEIKADCTFKTIAKRQDVRVYKGTDGVAKGYYALPSNSATSIGRGVITVPLPPNQSPIPAGILPPISASQRLVPFAQESVPAAFVAVGAGEAGVGLVAGLEATLGRTAAQGAMLIPQVRAAIIATGAATITAIAIKNLYNWIATPEAIPVSPIIPDLNDVTARFRKAELPVTAENATLEPPGNCGQEEFDEIRNRKERFCKVADNDGFKLGCVKEQFTTVIGIEKRIEQLDNCSKAREDEAMCMAGGNQGHKTELKNKLTDLFLCVKRLHAFPKVTP